MFSFLVWRQLKLKKTLINAESLRQIQAFQLVRNSKGTEATPSGWKPGKITLKPGPDLVGKVWEVWKTVMAFD
jgi:peroxiredoxin (alkyl hydroperoxide reductase subunit C)